MATACPIPSSSLVAEPHPIAPWDHDNDGLRDDIDLDDDEDGMNDEDEVCLANEV